MRFITSVSSRDKLPPPYWSVKHYDVGIHNAMTKGMISLLFKNKRKPSYLSVYSSHCSIGSPRIINLSQG